MRARRAILVTAAALAALGLVALACLAQPIRDLPKPTVPKPAAPPPAPAPPAPTPGSFTFCVFGDCRTGGNPNQLRVLSRIAGAMAAERPQVVLGTGDYYDGDRDPAVCQQQLAQFLQALQPLQQLGPVALAAALGNHDLAVGAETLRRVFGPAYYSFNIEQAHFVILDTEQAGEKGRITGKQWEWLVSDLQSAVLAGARYLFVALHQPLFPVDGHRGSSLDRYPRERDRLHALFVQTGVACVFQGHEHLFNRQDRDGVTYVITGGGGAPLYADELHGGFYHYLRVDVSPEQYTVAVKRCD